MKDWELRQRQSLPLEAKMILTQRRIREWYEAWVGEVFVSFSGGKDRYGITTLSAPTLSGCSSDVYRHSLEYLCLTQAYAGLLSRHIDLAATHFASKIFVDNIEKVE